MTIQWFDTLDSTQTYVLDILKAGDGDTPFAVVADVQHAGRGSRGNTWEGRPGNLFCSFAIGRNTLPDDLKLESSSIYFAYLLKQSLESFGSKVWLKWPNDFYLESQKVGGMITTLRDETLVCGVGINLKSAPGGFGVLDIDIQRKLLLNDYFSRVESFPKWKDIFRLYSIEFDKSRRFKTHYDTYKFSLKNAVLCEDGAIECQGQRMYSQR